jgi:hypothetical protein
MLKHSLTQGEKMPELTITAVAREVGFARLLCVTMKESDFCQRRDEWLVADAMMFALPLPVERCGV